MRSGSGTDYDAPSSSKNQVQAHKVDEEPQHRQEPRPPQINDIIPDFLKFCQQLSETARTLYYFLK
jgi:hypothetical protein